MDPFTWRSEFTIFNITNSDYGDYECFAKNSEGLSKHRILLDVKSRPDTPTQLQVQLHLILIPFSERSYAVDQWKCYKLMFILSRQEEDVTSKSFFKTSDLF